MNTPRNQETPKYFTNLQQVDESVNTLAHLIKDIYMEVLGDDYETLLSLVGTDRITSSRGFQVDHKDSAKTLLKNYLDGHKDGSGLVTGMRFRALSSDSTDIVYETENILREIFSRIKEKLPKVKTLFGDGYNYSKDGVSINFIENYTNNTLRDYNISSQIRFIDSDMKKETIDTTKNNLVEAL